LPSNFPKFTFFAGKGGVGKTTCAAAWAIAEARAGRRVLAISIDPAHSLGDALGVRLSARACAVGAGRRSLAAVELDGPRAFRRWLRDHRHALGEVLEHGTWLDRDDIDALLELSIPGIDELVAMLEIVRLAHARDYDLVVVDTAPTGHTLRLLAAPDVVGAVADALEGLQREHRLIREQLARVGRPEAADRLIALLAGQAQETGALLKDPHRTTFHWVLLPEMLSVAESEDGLRTLGRAGIHVSDVIVNRLLPDGPPCPICDRRREAERASAGRMVSRLKHGGALHVVRAEAREPRGVVALARIGRELRDKVAASSFLRSPPTDAGARGLGITGSSRGSGAPSALVLSQSKDERTVSPAAIPAFQGASLLLFGGKGGVGKTTVAAASALGLARASPLRKVLLLSTDPAHSLSDVFNVTVGDRAVIVPRTPKNLHVRELDAAAALAARRTDLEAALNEIAEAFGADHSAIAGGRGVSELMDLAPPGIDELFGILEVADLLNTFSQGRRAAASQGRGAGATSGRYDLVVIDAAPTGHALRLLEMPDAAREWVQVLLRVLLKYRELVRPGQLAAELVELSKSIRRLQDLLHNPVAARFIVVTRPAAVPRVETERLIGRLRHLRLAVPAIVINAVTLSPQKCPWCRAIAAAERREISRLTGACGRGPRECAIILTPLAAPPPRGRVALERWSKTWIVPLPTSTA
jgi:arsenite/tail-anchored protein-transporting ATPase